jgi:hypothetical protein
LSLFEPIDDFPLRVQGVRRRGDDGTSAVEPRCCALVHEGQPIEVYNEEAFRYFLDAECRRAEALNGSFLLVLMNVSTQSDTTGDAETTRASRVFAALTMCLRETDFVGWYQAGSIAGAVLTEHPVARGPVGQEVIRGRVLEIIGRHLSPEMASRLEVRAYRFPLVD